jgi:hypothetical protein
MDQLLQSPWLGWAVLGAGVLLGLWEYRHLLPSLSGLTSLLPSGKPAKLTRKSVVLQLDDVIAYCEANNCPTGVEYFKAGMVHLYSSHSH